MTANGPTLLKLKTANDWLSSAMAKPFPMPLLSNLWHEGELAIMFADTGVGKSALAVQIAQSVATGLYIKPFQSSGVPQNVLYVDLELTEKQFELRYCRDNDLWDEPCIGHFRFADGFFRAEIDLLFEVPAETTFAAHLLREIERLLDETGSKVLIIDNLSCLRRSNENSSEAILLMRELRRLRDGLGISILVLAHTPKRRHRRRLSVTDLQGSKAIANFADSIFAIGESCLGHNVRYIKHIKCRSGERFYDSGNVPGFLLCKNDNFLGFDFAAFGTEIDHLKDFDTANRIRYERSLEINALIDEGFSQRAIADRLGISPASVNRYIHEYAACACDKVRGHRCPNHATARYGYQQRYETKHPEEAEAEAHMSMVPEGMVYVSGMGLIHESRIDANGRLIKKEPKPASFPAPAANGSGAAANGHGARQDPYDTVKLE